jgi:hypothetical protein
MAQIHFRKRVECRVGSFCLMCLMTNWLYSAIQSLFFLPTVDSPEKQLFSGQSIKITGRKQKASFANSPAVHAKAGEEAASRRHCRRRRRYPSAAAASGVERKCISLLRRRHITKAALLLRRAVAKRKGRWTHIGGEARVQQSVPCLSPLAIISLKCCAALSQINLKPK